jgi:hypothetical protein
MVATPTSPSQHPSRPIVPQQMFACRHGEHRVGTAMEGGSRYQVDVAEAEMVQEGNPKLIRPGSSSCLSFISII